MAKRMKKTEKKSKIKFFIITIIIALILILFILGKDILLQNCDKESIKENEDVLQTSQIIEEKYVIEDFENFSFTNAEIKTENGISYINIELKNKSNEKSEIKKITILLSGKTKQLEMAYTLPEIEANAFYNMKLNVIEDLSDILSIEIKT